MKLELEAVVTDELAPLHYELAEFRVGGTKSRPVLDIRIDRLDGQKVQVGDCERASRAIEARLDELQNEIRRLWVLKMDDSPYLKKLVESMPGRLQEVIAREEFVTHY